MRTAIEIATDIETVRVELRGFDYMNVAGRTVEEMAKITAAQMQAAQKMYRLDMERMMFVQKPAAGGCDGPG